MAKQEKQPTYSLGRVIFELDLHTNDGTNFTTQSTNVVFFLATRKI